MIREALLVFLYDMVYLWTSCIRVACLIGIPLLLGALVYGLFQ